MSDRYETNYFASLTRELSIRAARATISKLGPVSSSLRAHLREVLERGPGEPGSFLADPVFEAAFGWKTVEHTMAELDASLVHPRLVAAMDAPPEDLREYTFRSDLRPYEHQVESWRTLRDEPPRSAIISSGTGSGKTECFLVPILDSLVRQLDGKTPLQGVQALLLYPLNALINSQRDRLRAWTAAFGGAVRFCLYNGDTPDVVPAMRQRDQQQEVLSRRLLRESPPPVLVTNSTMLEYMLVRQEDRPILDHSAGKLHWIVLDEAHTYIGSQAAELSFLLRRVLHAFSVDPTDVRFIATSATIGNTEAGEAKDRLRQFLADIAGIAPERVQVVTGDRAVPELPPDMASQNAALPPMAELRMMSAEARFESLAFNPSVRLVRQHLVGRGPLAVNEIAPIAGGKASQQVSAEERRRVLELLDVCRSASLAGQPFLPLRMHVFHRTQRGLWACWDPRCHGRKGTPLEQGDWPFGKVYLERREACDAPGCGGRVLEVVLCDTCGAEYLAAEEYSEGGHRWVRAREAGSGDEEEDDEERLIDEEEEEDASPTDPAPSSGAFPRLVCSSPTDGLPQTRIAPKTGEIDPIGEAITMAVVPPEDGGALRCPRCGQREAHVEAVFRPARAGGPFFLRVAIPTLLEHTNPVPGKEKDLPFGGRRLITFSDSRQGTATFSLQAQIEAERNYVRSLLYHQIAANAPMVDSAAIENQRSVVSALEKATAGNAALRGVLVQQQQMLAAMEAPPAPHLSWREAAEKLAQTRELRDWMHRHWRHTGLGQLEPSELARFSLYREFARRPKRQNSLETLGLVSVQYPRIERLPDNSAPPAWRRLRQPAQEWRNFLKIAVDFLIRARSAVNIPTEHYRWVGVPIRPRFVVGPDADGSGKGVFAWPQVTRPFTNARLALLLCRALGLDLSEAEDRETVNDLLRAAWEQIRHMLTELQPGYRLNLDDEAELGLRTEAWLCPVTRRVLDTTLHGWTPYLTKDLGEAHARCAAVKLPRLPYPFWRTPSGADIPPEDIFAWLEGNEEIRELRERGGLDGVQRPHRFV